MFINWNSFVCLICSIRRCKCSNLTHICLIKYANGLAMTTSPNGNIFRVTGPLCGKFIAVTDEFPSQKPVTRSIDAIFDPRLNNRLSKQSKHIWFETLSRSLWRHCNGCVLLCCGCILSPGWIHVIQQPICFQSYLTGIMEIVLKQQ